MINYGDGYVIAAKVPQTRRTRTGLSDNGTPHAKS
jgi:hypothetical protein